MILGRKFLLLRQTALGYFDWDKFPLDSGLQKRYFYGVAVNLRQPLTAVGRACPSPQILGYYEVPTGWKYFVNSDGFQTHHFLRAKKASAPVRHIFVKKDGIWPSSVLAEYHCRHRKNLSKKLHLTIGRNTAECAIICASTLTAWTQPLPTN